MMEPYCRHEGFSHVVSDLMRNMTGPRRLTKINQKEQNPYQLTNVMVIFVHVPFVLMTNVTSQELLRTFQLIFMMVVNSSSKIWHLIEKIKNM